jgi:hypothetical protein
MQVINQDAALTHGTDITEIFTGQYWELIDLTNSLAGPLVSLSTLGAGSFITDTEGTVIVGASARPGAAVGFGGALSGDFISGTSAITSTERIFTLGKVSSDFVQVRIHNVITPQVDNANDYLEIENIHLFPDNKVTLLDRWGVKVKEWVGYENVSGTPSPSYDLSKVATGNYICILEYTDGSSKKKEAQMITIINQ